MATITVIKDRMRKLNPAGFQILCDDYLSRIGYPNLVSLGTMAGSEKTTKGTPGARMRPRGSFFYCLDCMGKIRLSMICELTRNDICDTLTVKSLEAEG